VLRRRPRLFETHAPRGADLGIGVSPPVRLRCGGVLLLLLLLSVWEGIITFVVVVVEGL